MNKPAFFIRTINAGTYLEIFLVSAIASITGLAANMLILLAFRLMIGREESAILSKHGV